MEASSVMYILNLKYSHLKKYKLSFEFEYRCILILIIFSNDNIFLLKSY